MKISHINPFMRYAMLQPSVLSKAPLKYALDYRMFYVLEGCAGIMLKDGKIEVSAGSLVIREPYTPYYFDGHVKVIVLNFDLTREDEEHTNSYKTVIYDENANISYQKEQIFGGYIFRHKAFFAEKILQECIHHHEFPSAHSDAYTSALIKGVIASVLSYASDEAALPLAVIDALEFIRRSYDKDISNEDVANAVGYHSFYLNRLFKKHIGTTLHQALTDERIKIAKHLLMQTGYTVEKIAAESGFGDRTKFCTVFKKTVGITPKKFRDKNNIISSEY